METLTTLKQMLAGNSIFVPKNQTGYSWDTGFDFNQRPEQVNRFLSNIEEYHHIPQKSKYYLGHFQFKKEHNKLFIINGQDRLTTIIIFISALFYNLKQIKILNENEIELFEDTIKRKSKYRFNTVELDNQIFKDYIIDNIKKDKIGIESNSSKRFIKAFDFFTQNLKNKDRLTLIRMLENIVNAECTTYILSEETFELYPHDNIQLEN